MRKSSWIWAWALCLAATPAWADDTPETETETETETQTEDGEAAPKDDDVPSPDPPSEAPPEDEVKVKAREAFLQGLARAKKARWAEALVAFERSAALRALAVTTHNIGATLRALGRYVQAREAFRRALEQDAAEGFGKLGATLREETTSFLSEIEGLLPRVKVRVEPPGGVLSVDGRPLAKTEEKGLLLAGVLSPGKGEAPPASRFEVLLDPGAHVFTLQRKGFADAVVNRTFEHGERGELDLVLDKLPGKIAISATEPKAVVTVDGRDVGQVPLELSRLEGRYKVSVFKDGFVPYDTTIDLDPGEELKLRADLSPREPGIYERWWFWGGLGTAATAIAVTTYFVARPAPERPEANGGGLGWVIDVP